VVVLAADDVGGNLFQHTINFVQSKKWFPNCSQWKNILSYFKMSNPMKEYSFKAEFIFRILSVFETWLAAWNANTWLCKKAGDCRFAWYGSPLYFGWFGI
jgi:hypothetical protein